MVLLYGDDAGMIRDRAEILVRAVDSLDARRPIPIAMTALPGHLEAVAVRADAPLALLTRLAGFDERARRNVGGTYLRRVDLDATSARRVSDLMRRVPGTRVVDSSGVLLVASSRGYKVDLQRGDGFASPL